MGQAATPPHKSPSLLISPLPGTYGSPTRKKSHLTIYSPSLHLFAHVPFTPSSTVQEVKFQLQLKLNCPLEVRLVQRGVELQDGQCLEHYKVTEKSLLRVEFVGEWEGKAGGSGEISGGLESVAVGSTKQDSGSISTSRPWEIDFSIYALPDAELSVPPIKRARKGIKPVPKPATSA